MRRLLLILLSFLFSHSFVIAGKEKGDQRLGRRRQNRIVMKAQISKLKGGALLVMLHNKENSIDALRKIGRYDLAAKVESKQVKLNKSLLIAFKSNFTFCPAYFFFSNQYENISSRQFDRIIFLNENLKPDSAIEMHETNFLAAELGMVDQDTAKYFNDYYFHSTDSGLVRKNSYYGSPDMRFGALKIMSDEFIQLKRPFPYYVRTWFKRSPVKIVTRLNKKLDRYYNRIISSS